MIRSFSVEGFKSIASLSIELGRVNCFIGANGVGKSNVLEAIGVLGAAANGRVDDEALLRRGVRPGAPRLYKTAFSDLKIRPQITLAATSSAGASYRVALQDPPPDEEPAWRFDTEVLSDGSTDVVSRDMRSDKISLEPIAGLAALKAVELAADNAGGQLLRLLQSFAIYCPNTPTLRGVIPDPQPRRPVGLAGGQLVEGFDYLQAWWPNARQNEKERLEDLVDLMDWASGIQTLESDYTRSLGRGQRVLIFRDRFMQQGLNSLGAHDASEGALYVVFAAVLCMSPHSPPLIAIDNLDQALNPRLVTRLTERLIDWLRAIDDERQLLFTAHNPAVLDGLDLADDEVRLFAVERNTGGHTCVRRVVLSGEQLKLLEQYPLSRLWMMGNLGAVPNV